MKTRTLVLGCIIVTALVLVGFRFLYPGGPEAAFRRIGNTLEVKIRSGYVGMNCYGADGEKVIAPSRFFGPEWVQYRDLSKYVSPHTFTVTCRAYQNPSSVVAMASYDLR